jgi:lipopolysaccharide export system protein LptA
MLAAAPALGQGLGFGKSNEPIAVEADHGIEWLRDSLQYIARGNAVATRGQVSVRADTLTAHYRNKPGGGTEVWRIDAEGGVRIYSETEEAVGDRAVYDVDQGVMVLVGKGLRFKTQQDTITARDSLEYWEKRQLAVARGNAVAVREEKRIRGDTLTAHLDEQKGGNLKVRRVDAFGNVDIATDKEVARGAQGVYDVDRGIATLSGDVKITRGQNQLNGEFGEVNLNTGVSRLLAAPSGRAPATGQTRAQGDRVKGLLMPDKDLRPGQGAAQQPAPAVVKP